MNEELNDRAQRELPKLERITKSFTVYAEKQCPELARRYPRLMKRVMLSGVKEHTRPFPGRPQDPMITLVLRHREAGLSWRLSIRAAHPEFDSWTHHRKLDTIRRYQSAKRARAKAARKIAQQMDGQNIQADFVSAVPTERESPESKDEEQDA